MTTRKRIKFDRMLDTQQRDAMSGKELGCAGCAYEFLLDAVKDLNAGDYAGFLCALDLAGKFASDARDEFYARKHQDQE